MKKLAEMKHRSKWQLIEMRMPRHHPARNRVLLNNVMRTMNHTHDVAPVPKFISYHSLPYTLVYSIIISSMLVVASTYKLPASFCFDYIALLEILHHPLG